MLNADARKELLRHPMDAETRPPIQPTPGPETGYTARVLRSQCATANRRDSLCER
jgi:hypothetical protein